MNNGRKGLSLLLSYPTWWVRLLLYVQLYLVFLSPLIHEGNWNEHEINKAFFSFDVLKRTLQRRSHTRPSYTPVDLLRTYSNLIPRIAWERG